MGVTREESSESGFMVYLILYGVLNEIFPYWILLNSQQVVLRFDFQEKNFELFNNCVILYYFVKFFILVSYRHLYKYKN